jgi:peroxiredoxin Q/BCP
MSESASHDATERTRGHTPTTDGGTESAAATETTPEDAAADRPAPPDFELRNAGAGPDPLSLADVDEAVDFAILLLLRDYHCPKCRAQVQRVAEKAQNIERGDAAVVAILPDTYERAASWQADYDLPFPLLADPGAEVNDEYDQPTRFGVVGRLHDVIGRMPKAIVLDLRGDAEVAYAYEGSSPADRPEIEHLFDQVDDLKEGFVFDCDLVDC